MFAYTTYAEAQNVLVHTTYVEVYSEHASSQIVATVHNDILVKRSRTYRN